MHSVSPDQIPIAVYLVKSMAAMLRYDMASRVFPTLLYRIAFQQFFSMYFMFISPVILDFMKSKKC